MPTLLPDRDLGGFVAPELVGYFRTQLAGHYTADMYLGPRYLIPVVQVEADLITRLVGEARDDQVRQGLLDAGTAYAAMLGDRDGCARLIDAAAAQIPRVDDEHPWGNACRRTPNWAETQLQRAGNEIWRAFTTTYHECVHFAVYVAAKAQEISHHPDIHITWQRIEFRITTHDAGHQLTEADFKLAKEIDAIAERRRATPEDIAP